LPQVSAQISLHHAAAITTTAAAHAETATVAAHRETITTVAAVADNLFGTFLRGSPLFYIKKGLSG